MASSSSSVIDPEWDAALAAAFGVLLGEEWAADAAGYAVYYESDTLEDEVPLAAWLTPEALIGREPVEVTEELEEIPFSAAEWRFDLGNSLFDIDPMLLSGTGPWGPGGHLGPGLDAGGFADGLRAVSLAEPDTALIRGADLAPLLTRHGVDLVDEDTGGLRYGISVLLRVATDGTLADAMRAATFTHRGPDHLVPFSDDGYVEAAEEGWEEALEAVTDPRLRDHLRMLCLDAEDARGEGAYYFAAEEWPVGTDELRKAGCSLVAGWEFGEAQAGVVVVRLGDKRLF